MLLRPRWIRGGWILAILIVIGLVIWLLAGKDTPGPAPPPTLPATAWPAPLSSAPVPSSNVESHPSAGVDLGVADFVPGDRRDMNGRLRSVGSDTMNNLVTLWAEGVRRFHPGLRFEVEGKGSATAVPALIAGTAQVGPMSRPMKDKEVADFRRKFDCAPTALVTCIDMLAIYVHKDNPVLGLSLVQVDAIFSRSRKGGAEKDITTWGQLGLTGDWADKPITLYGRNPASGTYGYFKEHALLKGDYKDSVKEQPGSSAVVHSVAGDRYAIGYSGIGYRTADVRVVPLAKRFGDPFVEAEPANGHSGEYPLSRFLYLYVNAKPGTDLDPGLREFLRYVFSRQGQEDVKKAGFTPLTPVLAREQVARVGLR